jgi:hypothetical protein
MKLAEEIYTRHTKIVAAKRNIVAEAIGVGELLNQAKARMKHGEWLPWLKNNCLLSERTANRYMWTAKPENKQKLEQVLAAKSATMADLDSLNEAVWMISEEDEPEAPAQEPAETAETEDTDDTEEEATATLLDKIDNAQGHYFELLVKYAEAEPGKARKAASEFVKLLTRAGLYKRK